MISRNPRVSLAQSSKRHWYLRLRNVEPSDRGYYMCQVDSINQLVRPSSTELIHFLIGVVADRSTPTRWSTVKAIWKFWVWKHCLLVYFPIVRLFCSFITSGCLLVIKLASWLPSSFLIDLSHPHTHRDTQRERRMLFACVICNKTKLIYTIG